MHGVQHLRGYEMNYPTRGIGGQVVRRVERRRWVPFAFIGEHGGALLMRDPYHLRLMTDAEVNAASNTTIVLAKMRRVR